MQRRTPPALSPWRKGCALRDRTDPQAIALRVFDRAGIDRRAAIAAKGVTALVAAFSRLHISLRGAAEEHEMLGRRRDVYTKGRAGERLTISAVADVDRIGIDLRFEGNLAAMTMTVDLHASYPVIGDTPAFQVKGSHPCPMVVLRIIQNRR